MKILVIAETDGKGLRKASLSAVECARQLTASGTAGLEILVMGTGLDAIADEAATYADVALADDARLEHPLADRFAAVIAAHARATDCRMLLAAATGWAKDIVGRAAGVLGAAMASDVVAHEFLDGELVLSRPMFAGSVLARVKLIGDFRVLTIRPSAYPQAKPVEGPLHGIRKVNLDGLSLPQGTEYAGTQVKDSDRPDAMEASIVVCGGRAFRDREDFESNVGALADRLGAAVGASRALVDGGIAPNELQIGQTGKIVAPELYLALGLSGAIQHLAGITNSRIIAAVNKDPDAPIFSVANYGLVGDVHEVVPEMIKALG